MTDKQHDCGHDEHYDERIYLNLTPGGLRLNVLGLIAELYSLMKDEDYEGILDLLDVTGQMLTAAWTGHYDALEKGYEEAITQRFKEQLEDPQALTQLTTEEEQ